MANIVEELREIKEAIYGNEVRDSIHDAIKAGNDQIEGYAEKEVAREAAEVQRSNAEIKRAAAETKRQEETQAAVNRADTAATSANEAADRASAAAGGEITDKTVTFATGTGTVIPESGETLGDITGKLAGSVSDLDTRLKNTAESMGNGVFTSDDTIEGSTFETQLDADTLGGQAPGYYAKQADFTPEAVTFTPAEGVGVYDSDCLYIPATKSVYLNLQLGVTIGTDDVLLGTIPDRYAPRKNIPLVGRSDAIAAMNVYVAPDGNIYASASSTQYSIRFSACYIAK